MTRCCIRDTHISCGDEGGGTIKLHGVGSDITVGGNLVEVRSDILQKGSIAHKTGGVDVASDMHYVGPLVIHIEVGTNIKVVYRCSVGDTNLSRGHKGGGTIKLYGVCGDISIGCNLMEVRCDIFQEGAITDEAGGIDVTGDIKDVGPRVIHIEVGTHVEVVHRCSVGDTNLSRGHKGGGTIKLQGVCGDISIGGNLVKVRSDILQKSTITHKTGGIDVTSDMEDVGPLVIHIEVGTHVEVVHRCSVCDTDTVW